jgi:hypothetical protein
VSLTELATIDQLVTMYTEARACRDYERWVAFYPEGWRECVTIATPSPYPVERVCDAMAALSPQVSWDQNIRLCRTAVTLASGVEDINDAALVGTALADLKCLSNSRRNAVSALTGNGVSGPKVTCFAANLRGNMCAVTIDRHMKDIMPGLTHTEQQVAVYRAAMRIGIWPAELQAVLWGYWRNLKGLKTY